MCAVLGYRFQRLELLEEALTHRSFAARNNERLEFLGDALLNLAVAEYLFQQASESQRRRAEPAAPVWCALETLAELARSLEARRLVAAGAGRTQKRRQSTRIDSPDTVEAIVGATYLDGGFEACRACVESVWG